MPGLTMLTFADLTAEIDKKVARVRDDESRLHWERLKEVVEGVAGETSAADFDPTGTGDTWWLTKVQVFGFRGIPAEGLELELPTGPGLTIVHGANGAGKSSLAGAIDVGLHTSADASITRRGGSGGNAAVWQPVLVNAAAPEGRILLELRSSEREGLVIECLVQGGDVVEHTATYAKSSGEQTTLALGAAWQSVLHAYGPVYAYSAWEQYIQAAKDLKDYISRLLLLGGCFSAVQAAIDVRTNQGQRAVQAINDAVREGESAVTQIEEQFERKLGSGLPVATVDIDEWWEGLSLPDPSGESSVGFSDVNLDEFFESVQAAHAVADELHGADAQRNVSLVQALTAVSSLKPEVAHTGECPVCGSETDWRAHLHDVLKGDDKTIEMVDRWGESLALLKEQAKHVLDSLLPVADPAQASSLEEARTAWDRLEEATPFNRALESTAARNAALDLIHVLTSHEFRTQAAVARERASIEAAWKQALANSLAPLRSALREHGDSARDHAASAGAHGKLRELERLLYASRKDALKTATDKALRHLLRDAGVKIQGLEVLRTKADIRLTDLGGRDLELGMLSPDPPT